VEFSAENLHLMLPNDWIVKIGFVKAVLLLGGVKESLSILSKSIIKLQ
jgi:hypothetical protein